jgi:hypothetical protein
MKELSGIICYQMSEYFHTKLVKPLFCDKSKSSFLFYSNDELKKIDSICGLAGESLQSCQIRVFKSPMDNKNFNAIVDIDSSLPLFCIPLVSNPPPIITNDH